MPTLVAQLLIVQEVSVSNQREISHITVKVNKRRLKSPKLTDLMVPRSQLSAFNFSN